MFYSPSPLCGCYHYVEQVLHYIPRMEMSAHTTISGASSSTTLRQTFVNTLHRAIPELSYAFPLYDGVSVVEFKATIGTRVIKGVVKERAAAKAEYQEAKDRGEAAALVEQSLAAADVFNMRIGNVGPKESVVVELVYLGELDHDTQVDGLRFQIPTSIAPRYSSAWSDQPSAVDVPKGRMTITVDVEMPNSTIKTLQSPSHPLSVSIGTTSKDPQGDPSLQKASATLTLDSATLADDFVVQVVANNLDEPAAILEVHPSIPNQRAIMATLVPKFTLPPQCPEIVFVCDRSGSMGGQIHNLKAALNVFLKSLPIGVKFNICSFGSTCSFLWKTSKTYSQDTLDEAMRHVGAFSANFGGTEMYQPMEQTFKRRFTDMNLEVFLLTDGEIWCQDQLFNLVNQEVKKSKGNVRVFSLGIGAGASTSLVKGVARAGGGFAQFTQDNERMDKKIVRMLRASLMPHVNDYTLEIKYENDDDDDEFELVEKVHAGLCLSGEEESEKPTVSKRPMSLFNKIHKEEDLPTKISNTDIPDLAPPRYLQTPCEIPALFPFSRTCVYVLLSDATPKRLPRSVVLRGTCSVGPLELEIPITVLPKCATVIHRLAARKELKELEEGRGWTSLVRVGDKSLPVRYPGGYDDIVEREGVRIGTLFQVASKWTSFVAVEHRNSDGDSLKTLAMPSPELSDGQGEIRCRQPSRCSYPPPRRSRALRAAPQANSATPDALASLVRGYEMPPAAAPGGFGSASPGASGGLFGAALPAVTSGGLFGAVLPARAGGGFGAASPAGAGGGFGAASPAPAGGGFGASSPAASGGGFGAASPATSGGLFGAASPAGAGGGFGAASPAASGGLFGASSSAGAGGVFGAASPATAGGLFGAPPPPPCAAERRGSSGAARKSSAPGGLFSLFGSEMPKPSPSAATSAGPMADTLMVAETSLSNTSAINFTDALEGLTALQKFEGNWQWSGTLETILGVKHDDAQAKTTLPDAVKGHALRADILATACAIAYFKKHLLANKDVWEMMVDKAETWLRAQTGDLSVVDAVSCI